MKQLSFIALAFMALAACCTEDSEMCPEPSTQTNSNPSPNFLAIKTATTRPFHANLFTSVDPDPNIPPTPCSGDIPGFANPGVFMHGTATHLGALQYQSSRIQDVACDLNVTTMLLTTSFSGQLAAANGDLIYVSGDDVIDASTFLTGAGTTGTITGTWTINGGTGRFAGATGSFTINGPVDFATTSFSCVCNGTITY